MICASHRVQAAMHRCGIFEGTPRSASARRTSRACRRGHISPPRLFPKAALEDTAAASSSYPPVQVRIQLARRDEHFDAVARVWAQSLLLAGLTELPPPSGEEELLRLTEEVALRLRQAHDRKQRAASECRSLRLRGEALLSQLRRGGMTVLEVQLAMRQLESVRRELRRVRRRRLWACLVAYVQQPAPPPLTAPPSASPALCGDDPYVGGAGGDCGRPAAAGMAACGAASPGRNRDHSRGRHSLGSEGQGQGKGQAPGQQHLSPEASAAAGRGRSGSNRSSSNRGASVSDLHGCSCDRERADGHDMLRCEGDSSLSGSRSGVGADCGSRSVLAGYVLVSVRQPLALLPPPLPSRAPHQLHVDALAVGGEFRRRGVASALLTAAERLASRWGGTSLWLHVDAANDAAVQLYSECGYGIARIQGGAGLLEVGPLAAGLWPPSLPARWPTVLGGGVQLRPAASPQRQQQHRQMQTQPVQTWPQELGSREETFASAGPGGSDSASGLPPRSWQEGLRRWHRLRRGRKFVMRKQLLQRQQPPAAATRAQRRPAASGGTDRAALPSTVVDSTAVAAAADGSGERTEEGDRAKQLQQAPDGVAVVGGTDADGKTVASYCRTGVYKWR